VVGNYAFVACTRSIEIMDITHPTNPVRVGGHQTGYSRGLHVVGSFIYVADSGEGLKIFERLPRQRLELMGADATGVRIRMSGPIGLAGQVQYSEDFESWFNLGNPVSFTADPVSIKDSEPGNRSRRFYRMSLPE
jgi:hypothetical protein